MAQASRTPETPVVESPTVESRWLGAVGAGLAGGIAMAVVMAALTPAALETMIPALYGQEGALVGVTAHLVHAAIFGVIFAAIVRFANLSRFADRLVPMVAIGLVYGVALWVLAASVVMPVWLDAVGVAGAPAVPTFAIDSLWSHAVYGIVLGAAYPYLKRY